MVLTPCCPAAPPQVLDFIHYCDVAEALAKDRVAGTTEWGWTRQLRYYHRAEASCKVAMAEATFDYTWEYQGNAPKLVYTPLTDKCYLTLTQVGRGCGCRPALRRPPRLCYRVGARFQIPLRRPCKALIEA